MIESVYHVKITVKDGFAPTPEDLVELTKYKLEQAYFEVEVEPVNAASPR